MAKNEKSYYKAIGWRHLVSESYFEGITTDEKIVIYGLDDLVTFMENKFKTGYLKIIMDRLEEFNFEHESKCILSKYENALSDVAKIKKECYDIGEIQLNEFLSGLSPVFSGIISDYEYFNERVMNSQIDDFELPYSQVEGFVLSINSHFADVSFLVTKLAIPKQILEQIEKLSDRCELIDRLHGETIRKKAQIDQWFEKALSKSQLISLDAILAKDSKEFARKRNLCRIGVVILMGLIVLFQLYILRTYKQLDAPSSSFLGAGLGVQAIFAGLLFTCAKQWIRLIKLIENLTFRYAVMQDFDNVIVSIEQLSRSDMDKKLLGELIALKLEMYKFPDIGPDESGLTISNIFGK